MLNMLESALLTFCNDEDGAVTMDFVVLTSTIVLLGAAVVGAFEDETKDLANNIASNIAAVEVSP